MNTRLKLFYGSFDTALFTNKSIALVLQPTYLANELNITATRPFFIRSLQNTLFSALTISSAILYYLVVYLYSCYTLIRNTE